MSEVMSEEPQSEDSFNFEAAKSIVLEGELDAKQRNLWLKAVSAIEMGNVEYSVSLIQGILAIEPRFLDGRRLLRQAEGRLFKSSKGGLFGKKLGGGISSRKFAGAIKKDPKAALAEIEKALEKHPYDEGGNNCLYDAAMAAGMPETAAFALLTVKDGAPDNTKNLHKLAEHYLAQENPEDANKVYDQIAKIDPTDMEAIKGAKDASAQASMKRGGWDAAGGAVKANAEEAEDLEAAGRTMMTPEQIDERIAKLFEDYDEMIETKNLRWARDLATLYEKKEDWPNAVKWFEWAYSISADDPALKRRVETLNEQIGHLELRRIEEEIEANPEAPDAEEKRAMLAERRRERLAVLIKDAQMRVDANPTDKQLRFELGTHLFDNGDYQDAIPHLQNARQNPAIRIKSMLMLGKCFSERGMNDMASKALGDAASELTAMDGTKKDVVYELGLVYLKMGKEEESIECFKAIYEADYNYRDVAKRVEDSYG